MLTFQREELARFFVGLSETMFKIVEEAADNPVQ